jgi:ABC-type branched-subunit amino acid transport system substrate-binding protein
VQAYQAAYKCALPDDVAALSYDAVGLLREAFDGASGDLHSDMAEPSSLGLNRAIIAVSMINQREFHGATGEMRFNGHSRDPARGAVMLRVENGQFTLVTQL